MNMVLDFQEIHEEITKMYTETREVHLEFMNEEEK